MREEKDKRERDGKEGERWKGGREMERRERDGKEGETQVGEEREGREMERNGSKERERVTQNSSYYVFTNSQ